jgi:hypothetical protein
VASDCNACATRQDCNTRGAGRTVRNGGRRCHGMLVRVYDLRVTGHAPEHGGTHGASPARER